MAFNSTHYNDNKPDLFSASDGEINPDGIYSAKSMSDMQASVDLYADEANNNKPVLFSASDDVNIADSENMADKASKNMRAKLVTSPNEINIIKSLDKTEPYFCAKEDGNGFYLSMCKDNYAVRTIKDKPMYIRSMFVSKEMTEKLTYFSTLSKYSNQHMLFIFNSPFDEVDRTLNCYGFENLAKATPIQLDNLSKTFGLKVSGQASITHQNILPFVQARDSEVDSCLVGTFVDLNDVPLANYEVKHCRPIPVFSSAFKVEFSVSSLF